MLPSTTTSTSTHSNQSHINTNTNETEQDIHDSSNLTPEVLDSNTSSSHKNNLKSNTTNDLEITDNFNTSKANLNEVENSQSSQKNADLEDENDKNHTTESNNFSQPITNSSKTQVPQNSFNEENQSENTTTEINVDRQILNQQKKRRKAFKDAEMYVESKISKSNHANHNISSTSTTTTHVHRDGNDYINQLNDFNTTESQVTNFDEQEKDDVDLVIDQLLDNRQKRRGRKNDEDVDQMAQTRQIKSFLLQMEEAERKDRELNRKNLPALEKIKLLPFVTLQVEKKGLQELLLDNYLLQRFRDWLRPMPDGSLPNLDLRTEIYRLLTMLPIETDQLQESEGLGIEIMRMWKSPQETIQNRKILRRLIDRQFRPIFNQSADYFSLGNATCRRDEIEPERLEEISRRRFLFKQRQERLRQTLLKDCSSTKSNISSNPNHQNLDEDSSVKIIKEQSNIQTDDDYARKESDQFQDSASVLKSNNDEVNNEAHNLHQRKNQSRPILRSQPQFDFAVQPESRQPTEQEVELNERRKNLMEIGKQGRMGRLMKRIQERSSPGARQVGNCGNVGRSAGSAFKFGKRQRRSALKVSISKSPHSSLF